MKTSISKNNTKKAPTSGISGILSLLHHIAFYTSIAWSMPLFFIVAPIDETSKQIATFVLGGMTLAGLLSLIGIAKIQNTYQVEKTTVSAKGNSIAFFSSKPHSFALNLSIYAIFVGFAVFLTSILGASDNGFNFYLMGGSIAGIIGLFVIQSRLKKALRDPNKRYIRSGVPLTDIFLLLLELAIILSASAIATNILFALAHDPGTNPPIFLHDISFVGWFIPSAILLFILWQYINSRQTTLSIITLGILKHGPKNLWFNIISILAILSTLLCFIATMLFVNELGDGINYKLLLIAGSTLLPSLVALYLRGGIYPPDQTLLYVQKMNEEGLFITNDNCTYEGYTPTIKPLFMSWDSIKGTRPSPDTNSVCTLDLHWDRTIVIIIPEHSKDRFWKKAESIKAFTTQRL